MTLTKIYACATRVTTGNPKSQIIGFFVDKSLKAVVDYGSQVESVLILKFEWKNTSFQ